MDQSEWDYRVTKCIRTVDGDTFDLTLNKTIPNFGFYLVQEMFWSTRFRLLDIDTWETNQAGGAAASLAADIWIKQSIIEGVLRGQTFKTDNFGRWLIDLYRTDTQIHLDDVLRAGGHQKIKLVSA
jgi:endonuclease YncB( thermonuclease family)